MLQSSEIVVASKKEFFLRLPYLRRIQIKLNKQIFFELFNMYIIM